MGIAIGFLIPPILVPNVDDINELAHHIRVMFYISAGVATVIFILVIISKMIIHICRLIRGCQGFLLTHATANCKSLQCHITPTVMVVNT